MSLLHTTTQPTAADLDMALVMRGRKQRHELLCMEHIQFVPGARTVFGIGGTLVLALRRRQQQQQAVGSTSGVAGWHW
jgi:hypothetical protein